MPKPLRNQNYPWEYADFPASTARVVIQGSVLEYKVHQHKAPPGGGARGAITMFSTGARRRMLKYFHRINFADYPAPLLMTLTYPDEVASPSLAQRNIHRKVMARALEQLTGEKIPAAWRIEWVPRKSGALTGKPCPHWHWLIFKHQYIDYKDINRLWKKTIAWEQYCRTEIIGVEKASAVAMYMAKYLSKDACSLSLVRGCISEQVGRAYGWLRKSEIPVHPEIRRQGLSDAQRAAMMELAAERLPGVSEGLEQSFTLFGDVADDARRLIDGEPIQNDPTPTSADGVAGSEPRV